MGEKVFFGVMGLVEEKPKIQTLDINHDGLVLTTLTVLVFIEIQIAVFLEALFGLSPVGQERHVEEDVDLGRNLSVVRDYLDFVNPHRSIKLKGDLLWVCAEPFCLPTSVLSPEQQ